MTLTELQQMKRDGRKIVAAVLYDTQMAQIADRAGVDVISAGDSVGVALWGHASESELTIDQMLLVCQAVRRGVRRALVSCDVPLSALRQPPDAALRSATRLIREGGADLVKIDLAVSSIDLVRAVAQMKIAVWAQMSTAAGVETPVDRLVREAEALEAAGAAMLDFRHSGPLAGPAVVAAVRIPVIGGLGGGPWLDGRVRSIAAATGYAAASIDEGAERYANVAATTLSAMQALCDDVRAARPLRGEAASRS